MNNEINILSADWQNYALIDCGNQRKLERFGEVVVDRSEPKAWWSPALPAAEWKRLTNAYHDEDKTGKWKTFGKVPRSWTLDLHGIKLQARMSDGSKHLGIFPEQEPHWRTIREQCGKGAKQAKSMLNLFGYTGVASLVAAQAGAQVTHCDASKPSIAWGRFNQEVSKMETLPIRWILDDALKFAQRELKRERRYDAIILDPPSFGRGPRKEMWKVQDQIVEMLTACRDLLSDDAKFLILTMYNLEASSLMLNNLMHEVMGKHGGKIEVGEIAPKTENGGRHLPLSIYARWGR